MEIKQPFKNIIVVLVVTTLLILIVVMAQNNDTKELAQDTQIMLAKNITISGKGEKKKEFYFKAGKDYGKSNTETLQAAIDKVSENGGGTIYLPKGTYYFAYVEKIGGVSHSTQKDNTPEYWLIECKDNVTIIGKGTILKPYGKVEERWYRHVFL